MFPVRKHDPRQELASCLEVATLQVPDRVAGNINTVNYIRAQESHVPCVISQLEHSLGVQEYLGELLQYLREDFQRFQIPAGISDPSVFRNTERPLPCRKTECIPDRSDHGIGETLAYGAKQGEVDPVDRRAQVRMRGDASNRRASQYGTRSRDDLPMSCDIPIFLMPDEAGDGISRETHLVQRVVQDGAETEGLVPRPSARSIMNDAHLQNPDGRNSANLIDRA